ncbi:Uncharacterised protein [Rodentibacter pneumotropicus]|uniref:Uncharacterized protein n=1 Tax=Rodentibacter pneumotropicus TaxID=758 RepID=A0A3S4XRX7_9PAST|nr:Uncharacterised protein [Rodentibacter pneumotropicus]
MKKLFVAVVCGVLSVSAFAMTDKAKGELNKALQGDYQALRNVAFSMKDGSAGHDKNPVAGCALRKITLIVAQNETHTGDYGNEYVDCKALSPSESEQAWKMTLQLLPQVLQLKGQN